jgi:hypothetical protein
MSQILKNLDAGRYSQIPDPATRVVFIRHPDDIKKQIEEVEEKIQDYYKRNELMLSQMVEEVLTSSSEEEDEDELINNEFNESVNLDMSVRESMPNSPNLVKKSSIDLKPITILKKSYFRQESKTSNFSKGSQDSQFNQVTNSERQIQKPVPVKQAPKSRRRNSFTLIKKDKKRRGKLKGKSIPKSSLFKRISETEK